MFATRGIGHEQDAQPEQQYVDRLHDRIDAGAWRGLQSSPPGTWKQIRPAAAAADPSSGAIPTGYLIFNVTTDHIKRHAGGYVWKVPGV